MIVLSLSLVNRITKTHFNGVQFGKNNSIEKYQAPTLRHIWSQIEQNQKLRINKTNYKWLYELISTY